MLTASSGRGARSAVFAGVVALVLAGCSTSEDSRVAPPTEASTSGLDVSPTLDRESGAIVFPGDRFDVTNAEAVLLAAASGYVVKDCINGRHSRCKSDRRLTVGSLNSHNPSLVPP